MKRIWVILLLEVKSILRHYANCLNAKDTPPFAGLGAYPAGTLQCYTLSASYMGLPAGAKIVIIQ